MKQKYGTYTSSQGLFSADERSENRFRRSLIGQYISGEAEEVSGGKVLRLSGGEPIILKASPNGTLCGVWRGNAVGVIEQESIQALVRE